VKYFDDDGEELSEEEVESGRLRAQMMAGTLPPSPPQPKRTLDVYRDAAREANGGGEGCVMVTVFAGMAAIYFVGRFFGWWA
jgi:hypothetical protein